MSVMTFKTEASLIQAITEAGYLHESEVSKCPQAIIQKEPFETCFQGFVAIREESPEGNLWRVLGTPCPLCHGKGWVRKEDKP